ncbi:MAG: HEAT repeat domain-containing protein [Candidatus Poribacteria bacterium]|nr:HEAT repeat domain-containing protein [Candidatus Poribacteria bacterium]
MKKLLAICLVLIWVVSFGCKQEKIIPELSPGRDKLLGAGLAIDAIENHLKLAEIEEKKKDEPRALLLIGYSHALSTSLTWLKNNEKETEYRDERTRRLKELNTSEIEELFKVLNHGYRVQKDTIQILIDKGLPVIPLILKDLIESRYSKAHNDFVYILTQIGSKGLDQLYTAVSSTDTPVSVKIKLIRIIGDIGDPSIQDKLESLKNTVSDAGLKMEINATLYQLGNKAYQKDIEAGLSDNNVVVRRASARSVELLNQPAPSKLVNALKDTDDRVRRYIAKALQKHVDPNAVDNLFDMLTNNSSGSTKQIVLNTLNQYAEKGLADGLAQRLITLLTETEITDHEDRLRIVQLLSKPAVKKQIQTADPYDNLHPKIFEYFNTKETNKMVKDELSALLVELEKGELEE